MCKPMELDAKRIITQQSGKIPAMTKGPKTMEVTDYCSTDPARPVRILRNPNDRTAAVEPITVPALMKRTVENYGSHTALVYKDEVTKGWKGISYKEYQQRVERIAKAFIKLGLERHGTVAVLAFNSVEWFVSELAAIHAGGVITGVYTTNSVESCFHVLESSRANIVIVDDPKQMEKIYEIKDRLPNLKAVIQTLPPYAQYIKQKEGLWRWNELEDMDTSDVEEEYKRRLSSIAVNECCCLVYTSGTVGKPKGVMLSHDNFTWDSYSFSVRFDNVQMGNEVIVSYMPLSHVAAQILDIFVSLTVAGTVYFADKDALKGTIVRTLNEARPTFFLGVPRVYEKIHEKLQQASAEAGALKRLLAGWAKNVILDHHLDRMAGHSSNSVQYKLAKKLVATKVKQGLGFDRTKYFITGAAPMSNVTKKFFLSLDMQILEAFGMSETTGGHSVSNMDQTTFETIGRQLPGTDTKIINLDEKGHGEICVKGRHIFMGYINEKELTANAFVDDGFMRTGDVGYVDKDGYVFITGRIKELIITAGGENVPPVLIENVVKSECSALSNAMVVGDQKKFLTMLVTLKTEMDQDGAPCDKLSVETVKWLESMGIKGIKTLSKVLAAGPEPKVVQAIQDAINRANKKSISNAQKVQKFAILPNDFSIPTGELGPTMKLKRNVVAEKYIDTIEQMYQ